MAKIHAKRVCNGDDLPIAEQCGGVFYRLIPGTISALADATADRTVTPEEFHRTKSQAHEAIASILARVEGLRIAAGVTE